MMNARKGFAMKGYGSLLCFLLGAASALAAPPEPGVWYGHVNGYRIMLCVEEGRAAYYYAGQSAEIELDLGDGKHWKESVKGKTTGYWKIEAQSDGSSYLKHIEGVWGKVQGKERRPFELYHLEDVVSPCDSPAYRQTLLVPGEKLSLSLTPDRPAVMASDDSAAVLQASGDLWAWNTRQALPRKIGEGFVRAALGPAHFLGIKSDGSLWGWGSNFYGQLGGENVTGDEAVHMGNGFVAIAADREFSFAIRKDGTLWAWGGLRYDAKGNPDGDKPAKPVLLGKSFVSVAAGDYSYGFAAIKHDGTLWKWDREWNRPPDLLGESFAQVSVGYSHTVAVKKDGSLCNWGSQNLRPLENGMDEESYEFPVKIGNGVSQAAAGFSNTVAVKADGTLWLWGRNHPGMFGDCDSAITTHTRPVQVGENFVQAALGSGFLLALKRDGSAWTYGWPWEGDQLDTPRACRKPARVIFGDGVSAWDKPAKGVIAPKLKP
jgi:hypothetical protein